MLSLLAAPLFAADLDLPVGDVNAPIGIRSGSATSFRQGSYEVFVLSGGCTIRQGDVDAKSNDAVLWVDRAEAFSGRASRVIAYLEGNVEVHFGERGDPTSIKPHHGNTLTDRKWLGRFHTMGGVELSVPITGANPTQIPAIVERGREARQEELAQSFQASQTLPGSIDYGSDEDKVVIQPAQYLTQEIAAPATTAAGGGGRRVRFFPRSNTPFQYKTFAHPTRDEQVTIFSSGLQVVVDAIDELGTVTIETDRLVIWSPRVNLTGNNNGMNLEQAAYEFYLEGNIVFRQGDRVIFADRMYYNVARDSGTILSAEMLTPVPDYQGLLRLKAEVIQQIDKQHFQAYGAAITSSRLGVPRYWLQGENLQVEDVQKPLVDPWTGQVVLDPATGQPEIDHDILATSRNNWLYYGGVPLGYWPILATDLTNPTYYLQRAAVKQDKIFGTAVYLDFNMYQLLGIRNPPPNTKWALSTDYLSDRGPALGTNYKYGGESFWDIPGPYTGFLDAWGIHDDGQDFLGRGRQGLTPESEPFRGRIYGRHRHYFANDWRLTGELGYISDRNFLEQYFQQEWNNEKDETTGIELKKLYDNQSLSFTSDVRLNDFFTQTEWLPRADHYWIGQGAFFDYFTYYEHSQIGYAKLKTASTPTDPKDAKTFELLPWEVESEGVVAATRQSLEMPLQAGPVKVVPYALGEAAFWGEDLTGESLTRLYGQGGIKASLPMWTVNQDIQSELLNVRGMAHKLVFDAEYFFADANKDVTDLPLYHQLDDDAQEHFRRRLKFNTFGLPFGTPVPVQFDERTYAVRSGMQSWVTAPGTEIADDLQVLRLGMRNRWQTKRGLPGQERIVDYIVFDLEGSFFPDAKRDNFGETLGLVDYDFQWHVGDRFSILSDGYADFFSQGLKQVTIGGKLNRPEIGSVYLGYRRTDGPFHSDLILSQIGYRMSEKWVLGGGTAIDLNNSGKVTEFISLTRIGESFNLRVGVSYTSSQNNLGFQFVIEPRFLPNKLGGVGGVVIPPAGAYGVE